MWKNTCMQALIEWIFLRMEHSSAHNRLPWTKKRLNYFEVSLKAYTFASLFMQLLLRHKQLFNHLN